MAECDGETEHTKRPGILVLAKRKAIWVNSYVSCWKSVCRNEDVAYFAEFLYGVMACERRTTSRTRLSGGGRPFAFEEILLHLFELFYFTGIHIQNEFDMQLSH